MQKLRRTIGPGGELWYMKKHISDWEFQHLIDDVRDAKEYLDKMRRLYSAASSDLERILYQDHLDAAENGYAKHKNILDRYRFIK